MLRLCVYVCVCLCVCERERECVCVCVSCSASPCTALVPCVFACVCVCLRASAWWCAAMQSVRALYIHIYTSIYIRVERYTYTHICVCKYICMRMYILQLYVLKHTLTHTQTAHTYKYVCVQSRTRPHHVNAFHFGNASAFNHYERCMLAHASPPIIRPRTRIPAHAHAHTYSHMGVFPGDVSLWGVALVR